MFTLQHNHAQMGYFLEAKWLYICVMTFRYKIALHVKRTQWTARSCSDGLLWEATLLHVCVMILRYKVLNVKHKAMNTGETSISHSLFSALTTCHLRSSILSVICSKRGSLHRWEDSVGDTSSFEKPVNNKIFGALWITAERIVLNDYCKQQWYQLCGMHGHNGC